MLFGFGTEATSEHLILAAGICYSGKRTETGTHDITLNPYKDNVGTNVNSPTALDVNGTIKLDANYPPTGTGNVALGDQALHDGSLSGGSNASNR